MSHRTLARRCAGLLALLVPFAAGAADLTMAMTPRFAPEEILARITPLKERLETALGKSIEIVMSPDFKDFEKRLKSAQVDIAFSNPTIYPSASNVMEAVAMSSEGQSGARLRGIIITRADSGIVSLDDLKGHTAVVVGLKSTGGYLSQKVTLEKAGVDLAEIPIQEALENKQENVVLSVFYGDADVGFINEDALHIADSYVPPNQIHVIQRTAWMPNWALAVKRSLPADVRAKVRDAAVSLKPEEPAAKALKINGFVPATDADYDVVRQAAGLPIPTR